MLAEEGVCHLGPIREGCLGEEARELGRGRRAKFGWAEQEKVRASQAEGMAQTKAWRQEGST